MARSSARWLTNESASIQDGHAKYFRRGACAFDTHNVNFTVYPIVSGGGEGIGVLSKPPGGPDFCSCLVRDRCRPRSSCRCFSSFLRGVLVIDRSSSTALPLLLFRSCVPASAVCCSLLAILSAQCVFKCGNCRQLSLVSPIRCSVVEAHRRQRARCSTKKPWETSRQIAMLCPTSAPVLPRGC